MRDRNPHGNTHRPSGLAAILAAVPLMAPVSATDASPDDHPSALTHKRLDITMRAEQKTSWCRAAAGDALATWFGRTLTRNRFCDTAFDRGQAGPPRPAPARPVRHPGGTRPAARRRPGRHWPVRPSPRWPPASRRPPP
ncbi:hypothetical protein [Streptomyces sp. SP18CS02]|uniref:hypothetical protein n=1 Tax=Streptomyces sp. SP18CS02 TaxID=3002531 RepID=UPI002E77116C|nr:hypothetical protein [Streptomyces sp. SP18CS02]MEE1754930.1 hypothetical protein [Streptomyces sp. SP18CS02]